MISYFQVEEQSAIDATMPCILHTNELRCIVCKQRQSTIKTQTMEYNHIKFKAMVTKQYSTTKTKCYSSVCALNSAHSAPWIPAATGHSIVTIPWIKLLKLSATVLQGWKVTRDFKYSLKVLVLYMGNYILGNLMFLLHNISK